MNIEQTHPLGSASQVTLMERVDWRRFSTRFAAGLLAMFIGFGAMYWGAVWLMGPDQKARYTWSLDIQFLFSGVGAGQYPNGMAFAASDLISEVVLERALASIDSTQIDITPSQLGQQVAITTYFPRANEVIRSYESRLNDELSLVEVEELERAFQATMARGVRGQASLTLTHSDANFPGQAVLEAIPQAWAAYSQEELKTLSTDRLIYSARAIDAGMFENTDFIGAYGLARDQLTLLRRNLEVLKEEPNSGLIRDPQSGRRLADIEAQAQQLESIYLDNLLSQVVGLGLTRNPEATLSFLQARSEALARRVALLADKSERIDEALQDYNRSDARLADGTQGRMGSATGDAFLDRLVALGVESGDLEFHQVLTRQRLSFDLEATTVQSELRRLAVLSESVAEMGNGTTRTLSEDTQMIGDLSESFDAVVNEIRGMFDATNGIADQMDVLQMGGDGQMYRINHISDEPVALASLFAPGAVYWFWVLTVALALGILALVGLQETLDIIGRRRRV